MQKTNSLLILTAGLALLFLLACNSKTSNLNQSDETGFTSIFDGKTLANWDGDPTYWRVENGCLVGEVTPATLLKNNTFIIWRGGTTADFELKGSFHITVNGNSGINYRSEQIIEVPFALKGYQADIDGKINYTGQNYEERARTTLAYRGQKTTITSQTNPDEPVRNYVKNNAWMGLNVTGSLGSADSLKSLIKPEAWNEFQLVVKGNRLQHYINGVLMSDVTDEDTLNRKFSGLLGVQVHVGPPMKVQYKNLRIKKL